MLSYINIAFKYDWWLYCEIKAHKYIDDFMKHILLAIKKLSTVYGKKYRRTIFLLLLYADCGVISSIETVEWLGLFVLSPVAILTGFMVEFPSFHAHQVFITTRKCRGVSLAFTGWLFSFGWASKQRWFGGNRGQLIDKMADLALDLKKRGIVEHYEADTPSPKGTDCIK